MKSIEKINKRLENKLHICVGLDTDIKKIPTFLLEKENPILEFNKVIIENTKDIAACYKINLAFYEAEGTKGLEMLEETLKCIPEDIFVIGDAKRGDIGNTSEMYAISIYDHFKFDSITLHPYMGYDSLSPFIKYDEKLNFILVLTSNPGSVDFEKLVLNDGRFLYQAVSDKVKEWNVNKNLGVVFGATNSEELKHNIDRLKDLYILLPGVGAQGGSLEDVVTIMKNANHSKFIINVSRALLYTQNSENFGSLSREILVDYNNKIQEILNS